MIVMGLQHKVRCAGSIGQNGITQHMAKFIVVLNMLSGNVGLINLVTPSYYPHIFQKQLHHLYFWITVKSQPILIVKFSSLILAVYNSMTASEMLKQLLRFPKHEVGFCFFTGEKVFTIGPPWVCKMIEYTLPSWRESVMSVPAIFSAHTLQSATQMMISVDILRCLRCSSASASSRPQCCSKIDRP